jgi:hypothetical protein
MFLVRFAAVKPAEFVMLRKREYSSVPCIR